MNELKKEIYLPVEVFRNILDFCGDKELVHLRGGDDTRLQDHWYENSEEGKEYMSMDGQTASVHRDLLINRPPSKPGRVRYGTHQYDEYYSYLKWYKYKYYDEGDEWGNNLDRKYDIYEDSDKTRLILRHYETQDGRRYSKYYKDYDYYCSDCGCMKTNRVWERCYDCNIKYRKGNRTGFKKGVCLIKL